MMLGATHLSAWITVPAGGLLIGMLFLHWWRLSRPGIPPSRRRIRRVTAGMMLLTVPMLVTGLSVHDPTLNSRGYLLTWSAIIVMLLLIVIGAILDVVNNLRMHQRMLAREILESLHELSEGPGSDAAGASEPAAENGVS